MPRLRPLLMTNRGPLAASWARTASALSFLALLAIILLYPAVVRPSAMHDGTDTHLHTSWEAVNRLAYAVGQSPHWNPYSFSGYPGMADIQTLVYYPPAMLLPPAADLRLRRLGVSYCTCGSWEWGCSPCVDSLGRAAWRGRRRPAAVMLSGVVAPRLYLGHIVVLYGYAWIPLALALAIRSSRRATLWPHPALVAVLVLQVLAGFVQGTVYVGLAVAAVFLWRALDAPSAGRRLWLPLLQPVVLFALVGALAAFQLLPTFHLLLDAGTRPPALDYASASEDLIAPADLVTAVFAERIRNGIGAWSQFALHHAGVARLRAAGVGPLRATAPRGDSCC